MYLQLYRLTLYYTHTYQLNKCYNNFYLDIPDFFLIGLHAEPDPTNTSLELNALVHVYDSSTMRFQNKNGVLLGDFNADCTYLSNTKYNQLQLVNDPRFTWLLDQDTTTTSTVCAYDRLVIYR